MKTCIIKAIVAVALGIGVGAAFLAWYPFPVSLAWPGLMLARLGVPHSWLVAVGLMLALLVGIGWRSRSRSWWASAAVSVLVSAAYSTVAFLHLARMPVPLPPVTPYESEPEKRLAYIEAFNSGYRDGMSGILRSYCFRPEAETRGFYAGTYEGSLVWHRFLGREMPQAYRSLLEISAARDGVRLETLPNGQPERAASDSPSIPADTQTPPRVSASSRR